MRHAVIKIMYKNLVIITAKQPYKYTVICDKITNCSINTERRVFKIMLRKKTKKLWSYIVLVALVITAMLPAYSLTVQAAAGITITESSGWLESAYAEWKPVSGATGYRAYVKKADSSDSSYVRLDDELIRQYADYLRVDAVGLSAGSYVLKIEAVTGKTVVAAQTAALTVLAHDRSGFAFVNGTSSGAYNEDGTLKSNAVVIYVTEKTKDTVTLDVVTGKNNATTTCKGMQEIFNAFKKGKDSRPLCVRIIGNISDMAVMDKGDIMVDGNTQGVTIEGIGEDATANGWGIRVKGSDNVEIRNIGIMNCDSSEGDNIGLQQNNTHVWVHNCDFFYGQAGSDADQVKGDGALDTKTSTYITHSYNHFWDNGKCNLQGMKSEKTTNYITYHHNWYDHSDSRHPRIRTCSVHIYNNYFDGNAKYGVGVTLGASAFVENNYFRNCPSPMLSSMQGTDALGEGTFSGEAGGIIKAYNNTIVTAKSVIYANADSDTKKADSKSFDAYLASSPKEKVPSSYKTVSGGTAYNNFDTDSSIMYSYTAQSPEDAKNTVIKYAGRINGGDFKWTFDNSVDDASYTVNKALKSALMSYKTTLVSVGGNGGSSGGAEAPTEAPTQAPTQAPIEAPTQAPTQTPTEAPTSSASASAVHNFTADGTNSSYFMIDGNLSTSKGTVKYNGLTLKTCLKMESSTSVKFNTSENAVITLVVLEKNASKAVKVDGKVYASDAQGVVTAALAAGTHTITKADTVNLYYIAVSSNSGEASTEAPTEAATEAPTQAPTQAPVSESRLHNFTTDGSSSDFYSITGNLSTSKGTVKYDGLTLTGCLKLESSTKVTFKASGKASLTLVFLEKNDDNVIKVDGKVYKSNSDGIVTINVKSGTHTLTKAGTSNLYYISLTY